MFWKKKEATVEIEPKEEKLPGTKGVPDIVGRHIVVQLKREPDWVWRLKSVERKRANGAKSFDIRVFDEIEADSKRVKVKDYLSLEGHPELVLYEGWYDKDAMTVHLEEKRAVNVDVPIFTEAEIRQKVEALSEPGSTVFFYLAGSPATGGPLGRGAAVVELNPDQKGKKYIVYAADVEGMEPVGKGRRLFDTDNAKQVASYIKEAHHKPRY
ncbi:MAG: hypothetical protein HYX91_04670 [Chloroflexi bacterium]|nr:hypothetical protein [Chloroflexota bacterium]